MQARNSTFIDPFHGQSVSRRQYEFLRFDFAATDITFYTPSNFHTIRFLLQFYSDGDEDGYGDGSLLTLACESPEGHVDNDEDCDDTDAELYPLDLDGDGRGVCCGLT